MRGPQTMLWWARAPEFRGRPTLGSRREAGALLLAGGATQRDAGAGEAEARGGDQAGLEAGEGEAAGRRGRRSGLGGLGRRRVVAPRIGVVLDDGGVVLVGILRRRGSERGARLVTRRARARGRRRRCSMKKLGPVAGRTVRSLLMPAGGHNLGTPALTALARGFARSCALSLVQAARLDQFAKVARWPADESCRHRAPRAASPRRERGRMQGAPRMPRTALRFSATPSNSRRPAQRRPAAIRGVASRRACAALAVPRRSPVDSAERSVVLADWTDVGCLEEGHAEGGAPAPVTAGGSSAR